MNTVVAIIAVFGAVLSIAGAVQSYRNYKRAQAYDAQEVGRK
jgi:hypothetical protein